VGGGSRSRWTCQRTRQPGENPAVSSAWCWPLCLLLGCREPKIGRSLKVTARSVDQCGQRFFIDVSFLDVMFPSPQLA
jgi:hypothetical protein